MSVNYHEFRTQSNYLSPYPDDAGLCVRISGDLLLVYNTARGNPEACRGSSKPRSAIAQFSLGTGVRMARYLREAEADYKYMHTLTYPLEYPSDGRNVKQHLRRYCQELSREAKRRKIVDFSVFWFLEFQKRGAPHFHLFTTSFFSYKRCAAIWYAIVASGDLNHLKAGVRVESLKRGKKGMISYARKYARKQEQKEVPESYQNVGRFWGVHGLKKRVAAGTTFFVDSCRKPDVMCEKQRVFNMINGLLEVEGIKLLKRSFGFRLYHVDDVYIEQIVTVLKRAEFVTSCDDNLFVDAELTDDQDIPEKYLTDYELLIAKRAYLRCKYVEFDEGGVYK